jgi:signal recognition particle subunit SRP54
MFEQLTSRISGSLKKFKSKGTLSQGDVEAFTRELRISLLEADVALSVVEEFCAEVLEKGLALQKSTTLNPAQQLTRIVHDELLKILGGETTQLTFSKRPPTVILLVGLQGAGKTTLAGKLALLLKKQGHTPLLVAADLQRPNAVNQLETVASQAGVKVFAPEPGNGKGNPIKVAKAGVKFAEQKVHDIVIIDTAGRLAVDKALMKEIREIRESTSAHQVLFVLDAMTGQDAVRTADEFLQGVGFDAIVMSKLDGDARGGAALSVKRVTGKPILFASVGEKLTDFEIFYPDRMASRILDMGDMLTLLEKSDEVLDESQKEKFQAKLEAGEDFTLDDFLEQMNAIKNMGPISKVLSMLPGAGAMKGQLDQIDDNEIKRTAAIIQSMTPLERRDPKVLNASRRLRIARGSGMQVSDVNSLVERFTQAAKMMKQVAAGKVPSGIGVPPGSMKGAQKPQNTKKKKSKSGNPAKRAAEERGESITLPSEFKNLLKD